MSLVFNFFPDPFPEGGGNLGINPEALTNDNSSLYKQHGKGNKRWLECGTQLDKCKCLMINSNDHQVPSNLNSYTILWSFYTKCSREQLFISLRHIS